MHLLDTNVISEQRKQGRANPGVVEYFKQTAIQKNTCYISDIKLGEFRRSAELIRHRGDGKQADSLEIWSHSILDNYTDNFLDFTTDEAQVWGHLRVPHYRNTLDKQIVATALTHNLTLVTRNTDDFKDTGVSILNPFK